MSTLPSVEDVQKYTTDEVINFLQNENQNFNDNDFNILRRERVSGRAFLRMTKEDLIKPPYNFHGGPALEIVEIVESLNNQPGGGTSECIYIFIDNSNLYIEGRKETMWREAVNDHLVKIDYGKVVETVQNGRPMGSVPVVVGSRPPPEDTLWAHLRDELGYDAIAYDRNFLNREKEVDSEVSVRICAAIGKYVPGTIILISGDGDYGPVIRHALDKGWTIEIWFWSCGLSSRLTKMDVEHPKYESAIAHRTTIIDLDEYYKRFMFAYGYNRFANIKYLEIFTDLVKDNDIMEFYIELDLFGWWYRHNPNTLKLYVNSYSQWMELKNLMIRKYPNAEQISRDAFFLEKDTFFKMYLSFLKHKVDST